MDVDLTDLKARIKEYCRRSGLRVTWLANKPRLRFKLTRDGAQPVDLPAAIDLDTVFIVQNHYFVKTSGDNGSAAYTLWVQGDNPWKRAAEEKTKPNKALSDALQALKTAAARYGAVDEVDFEQGVIDAAVGYALAVQLVESVK